jgi:DNA-binding CsgD family transcriptional regulator
MTTRMLSGGYLDVMQSATTSDFSFQIVRFAESLGFKTVTATVVTDHTPAYSEFQTAHNAPADYVAWHEDSGLGSRDPVMQHCKRAAVPIVWDQQTYVRSGAGDLWEHQAQFGYSTGIALALHLPAGRHFLLGFDRDRPLSRSARSLTRTVAELQLFAVHAQDAAFRLFTPQAQPAATGVPQLTPRELEALKWTMEGKTAWEVGAIMSISERTAVLHLQNAMHKLGCVNKHQAVLKALRSGLLS